ncbi:MAG: hypothetical protein ACLFQB_12505 [Chitinispirillaceae bacterium]
MGKLRQFVLRMKKMIPAVRLSKVAARVIGFSKAPGKEEGLLMIQIDGLSRTQLEKALNSGKMPFTSSLLHRNHHTLHSMYSGLPSSTPAVQGEIFYGEPCAVPAFGFLNRQTGEEWSMVSAKAAVSVQKRLEKKSRSILTNGSAYSDIYNGGTEKSGFCSPDLGLSPYLQLFNPLVTFLLVLIHIPTIIRTGVLLLMELILALVDFARGLINREDFTKELSFIPARVGICVILRELITANVCIDCARGLPVIHCNLLGYDEQSHRRGPSSAFAHWTLKGIDDAVRRMYMASVRSCRRDYRVMIYSDHGQEKTLSYTQIHGITVQNSIDRMLREEGFEFPADSQAPQAPPGEKDLLRRFFAGIVSGHHYRSMDRSPRVISVGPVGHVYLPGKLDRCAMLRLGKLLVTRCKVPMVMTRESEGKVRVWNRRGEFCLPRDGSKVLGPDHPFLSELGNDLVKLVHHEDAGDFVINGWDPYHFPISFPSENGAHAGPGREETHGFTILPQGCPYKGNGFLRPSDLRKNVLHFTGKRERG